MDRFDPQRRLLGHGSHQPVTAYFRNVTGPRVRTEEGRQRQKQRARERWQQHKAYQQFKATEATRVVKPTPAKGAHWTTTSKAHSTGSGASSSTGPYVPPSDQQGPPGSPACPTAPCASSSTGRCDPLFLPPSSPSSSAGRGGCPREAQGGSHTQGLCASRSPRLAAPGGALRAAPGAHPHTCADAADALAGSGVRGLSPAEAYAGHSAGGVRTPPASSSSTPPSNHPLPFAGGAGRAPTVGVLLLLLVLLFVWAVCLDVRGPD